MKRRDFVALSAAAMLRPRFSRSRMAPWLLVPMDEGQADHLKAYGLAFRALERGERGDWLLNWRGGSFLVPASAAAARDAGLRAVDSSQAGHGSRVIPAHGAAKPHLAPQEGGVS